jgi:biopolymer transport protein ExbB
VGRRILAQTKRKEADTKNPLGRIMAVYEENRSVDVETLELKLDEAILREVPKLERGNTMIKVLSVVAPLLGLLGTVTGMIQTFQVITLFGAGDPKLMAGGISQALVTTVIGLVVAIPLTLLYSVVSGRSKRLVRVLGEQSAGIVASHAEQDRQAGASHVAAV